MHKTSKVCEPRSWPPTEASLKVKASLLFNAHSSLFAIIIKSLGCACFPEFLQNYSQHQILWSLSLVVFHALTLKLRIQTSLFVVPKLPVSLSSGQKCENFRKTSTPLCCFSE